MFALPKLVALPPETLEVIACNSDCRKDLLSLALSCRYLYSVVSHPHLQYYDIRCRLDLTALWTRLSHPEDGYAGLIHSLTILPNDFWHIDSILRDSLPLEERLPEEYQEYTPLEKVRSAAIDRVMEWEEQLNIALKRMKNLRQFRWLHSACVVEGEGDLWSTLNSLGTIHDLHILDIHIRDIRAAPSLGSHIATSSSFLSFRGLSSLDLRTDAYELDNETPDATALLRMLISNCPELERLCLHLVLYTHIDTASADILLRHEGWPNLRFLHLDNFNCTSSALSLFLASHALLEDICLPPMMPRCKWAEVVLPDGALPNLHKLECRSHTGAAMLKNPGALTKLRELRGIDLHDEVDLDVYFSWDDEWWEEHEYDSPDGETVMVSPWKEQLLEGIRNHPSITSVWLDPHDRDVAASSHLLELAAVAPQINQLAFGIRLPASIAVSSYYLRHSVYRKLIDSQPPNSK
ncbi:hypothetical protein NEOLEDRAFT_343389 [Neolentinus lepideus HHB14362 ss-1]|uniref:F-box domain-containing protein n=1 Tax=Neolentinus lepideus HHB14362 ss-1 TaxID=1314782 RepID=A0A165SPA9_9AGAM|nr:hypothetical protein NEOLEDRAFT_343389 [Neolentinus lepideus HHB14362 ss-1]